MKRFFTTSFFPAILFLLFTFYLLTIPGKSLPKLGWMEIIRGDKIIHIGMFAMLVYLWCLPLVYHKKPTATKQWMLLITTLAIAYGIGMEFVQKYYIPNRSFDTYDIFADTAGALLALVWCNRLLITTR